MGWGAVLNHVDSNGNTPLHIVLRLKSHVIPQSPQLNEVDLHLCVHD